MASETSIPEFLEVNEKFTSDALRVLAFTYRRLVELKGPQGEY